MEDEKDLMKQPNELEALKKRVTELEKKFASLEAAVWKAGSKDVLYCV